MKGEVKERGMIFNDEMVRAILEGRKTQTRRIMKNQPAEVGPEAPVMVRKIGAGFQWYGADGVSSVFNCPFGIVGDRIWVRETWAILGNEDGCSVDWNDNLCRGDEKNAARIYRASCEQKPGDYGLWSITGRAFFMWIEHPTLGNVPTYGGPLDSYTIPTKDGDGEFSCERYDHDFGGWVESECLGLYLIDDREQCRVYELEERVKELDAREISLPERSSMLHRTDFHDDYQTVMAYKVSEVIAAIRAAGIRIKGE
ncbi:hypothetical protein ODZ05_24465 [Escherichia coli]|nr:hypothetical protein [Escherichia coli]